MDTDVRIFLSSSTRAIFDIACPHAARLFFAQRMRFLLRGINRILRISHHLASISSKFPLRERHSDAVGDNRGLVALTGSLSPVPR
jgi:hypothetical protein